jgi:hypothetical protein
MVHGVFALMNICRSLSLYALVSAVMSADGSLGVCTHEHLTHCSSTPSHTALIMSADGSWRFALMNICQIAVLLAMRYVSHVISQQMVKYVCTMNI